MSDPFTLTWPADGAAAARDDAAVQALIQRCLAGDETAYVTLYHTYAAMIYRLTYSLLQHREDAEEVMQDSFEYAFRKLNRYDPNKASFKTWLYQIAISRSRNKRRRKWLPTFSLSQLLGQGQQLSDQNTPRPDEVAMLSDRQQAVWEALGQLSPKLRETAVLRYYDGLSYREIGGILHIPPKTAESRMRLARKALRELLADQDLF
jgi:RNA polymerase sigma-70 factor (ECF subfamily)